MGEGNLTITIAMPEAKILSHTDDNWEIVYEDEYQTSDIGSERNQRIQEKKKEREKQFIEDGKLEDAEQKAEEVIENFLQTAYGDKVSVTFTS